MTSHDDGESILKRSRQAFLWLPSLILDFTTHYTERYLGTPKGNAEGYEKSNVIPIADKITGRLLVVHGMADDNVLLFKNSTMLFKTLQDAMHPFEMMTYPGGKHGLWGEATQVHYHRTALDFCSDRSRR